MGYMTSREVAIKYGIAFSGKLCRVNVERWNNTNLQTPN